MIFKDEDTLRIEDFSLAYCRPDTHELIHDNAILNDISQEYHKGNIYGIIGYTGSGKSTLLRQIAGLNDSEVIVSSGEINFPRHWKMSYVFQQPFTTYNPMLSIYAHLKESYGRNILSAEEKERINHLLERYKIGGIESRELQNKSSSFSIGELQRIMWVMAIAPEPDLLLLDEPFAHVDSESTDLFIHDLRELRDRGAIILIASHLRKLMQSHADITYNLEGGKLKIHKVNPPQQLSDGKKFQLVKKLLDIHGLTYSRRSKNRKKVPILQDFNMELYSHQVIGIKGESGAGKSTLARIIAGKIQDFNGSVIYNEKNALPMERLERSRKVQLVPQDPVNVLPLEMKVEKMINDTIYLHRVDIEYLNYIDTLFPPVDTFKKQIIATLSGGQRQTLLFHLALLVNPEILIIDESFTAMDPDLLHGIWQSLRGWQGRSGSGLIIISHQSQYLDQMCDHSFLIKKLA